LIRKAKELKANQTKVVVKEIRFGPQTDDHDYNFQTQARAELPQGGGQSQGLRLLPRPFDRLQGAGRNPAAALCHRSRRVRQSGGDAPARRQEDEHDARAESEKVTNDKRPQAT